ncbi:MAG: rod shape-determining protein RodA [Spirochaetes bacterium]|nr:MAG: rod shape-determining protein RodA [Spirochaetota bacterium]
MKKVSFIGFDFLLFFAVLGLIIIGILFIYSSGVTSTGVVVSNEYIKQIIWAISGIVLFVLFSYISYERYKNWAVYIYFISILLLIVTPIIGKEVNGAKSWLGIADIGIQPSEFSKISVILFLAYYFYSVKKEIKKLSKFLIGFIIVLVPMALILLQPDTGTAIVYFPIFLFMAFIAGADLKHIMFLIFVALVAGILISFSAIKEYIITENSPLLNILSDPSVYKYFLISISIILLIAALGYFLFRRRYFYWITYSSLIAILAMFSNIAARHFMKNYQIMRLIIFLKPDIDPRGSGWNIIQSITAVGSGGFWGKGFLKGTQSHYRFLPQQSTDFIFSILSEEWGFLGCILIFALFLIILLRGVYISYKSRENYATLIGTGIVSMLFLHAIVNIGMSIGIMPITGLPLFFLSYGGSSLWTALIGVAILNNINMQRRLF